MAGSYRCVRVEGLWQWMAACNIRLNLISSAKEDLSPSRALFRLKLAKIKRKLGVKQTFALEHNSASECDRAWVEIPFGGTVKWRRHLNVIKQNHGNGERV